MPPFLAMRYVKHIYKQNPFVDIECVSFKEQLSALEAGADILDEHINDNYQLNSQEEVENSKDLPPMGLVFVSRINTGPDFHNPIFSNVAERLGLDVNFDPKPSTGE